MFLENLAAALLRLCDTYQLTYESAAERCDISSRHFGSLVRRKSDLRVRTLERICTGFAVTPNELLLPQNILLVSPTAYPICPHCKVRLEREQQEYCGHCGQHLDWSEFAKEDQLLPL